MEGHPLGGRNHRTARRDSEIREEVAKVGGNGFHCIAGSEHRMGRSQRLFQLGSIPFQRNDAMAVSRGRAVCIRTDDSIMEADSWGLAADPYCAAGVSFDICDTLLPPYPLLMGWRNANTDHRYLYKRCGKDPISGYGLPTH